MSNAFEMVGQPAELRFTLTVKRADTGIEENYEMVGYQIPENSTNEGEQDGCNS